MNASNLVGERERGGGGNEEQSSRGEGRVGTMAAVNSRDKNRLEMRSSRLVRGPIPKSRSEKAVWSHEREQRFLYINVKIRPSFVRLRRSY